MDITKYKSNPKTQYLAVEYERLLNEEKELHQMDGDLKELAQEDLKKLKMEVDLMELKMEEHNPQELNNKVVQQEPICHLLVLQEK